MTRLISSVILTITCFSAWSQARPPIQIAPGVYYYFGDELQHRSANCVWIVFNDYVLVADANYPWAAKDIITEIKKTSDKPIRFVLNTHYHHDHTFGNGIFGEQGATIVSTTKAAEEMRTLGKLEWQHNYSGQPLDGYTQVYPTMTFNDQLTFADDKHTVQVIAMGPAHSWGDAVVLLPKEKILITGDLFVHGNPWGNNVADPHSDYDRWLTVLDTLASWDIKTVIPGHGDPAGTVQIKQQRAYLSDMLTQVRKGIREEKTKEQLIKSIDLSKHPLYGDNKTSTIRSVGAMYDLLKGKRGR